MVEMCTELRTTVRAIGNENDQNCDDAENGSMPFEMDVLPTNKR